MSLNYLDSLIVMILDSHTHHPAPQPEGIISCSPRDFSAVVNQKYSVGIHPWRVGECTEDDFRQLDTLARRQDVVAIGEAGIDLQHKGAAPMYRQLQAFRRQIALSEEVGKPLVIHDVKAHDVVLALHKEYSPRQPWIIHGFRGKPSVLRMLMRPGVYFSFGEKYNVETLRAIPATLLLAETDESPLSIADIIESLSRDRGEELRPIIEKNTAALFR